MQRKMEEDGCTPNACSYNVIIQGFLQHKDTSTAMQLICEMVNRGFSTDAATRTFLLNLPTNDGSPALKNLPGLCDDHQDVKGCDASVFMNDDDALALATK